MRRIFAYLPFYISAIWLGSFVAIGGWVVPTLFARAPSKSIAGQIAAELFSAQTLVCRLSVLAIAALLLWQNWQHLARRSPATDSAQAWRNRLRGPLAVALVAAYVFAIVQQYLVAPQIVAKTQPALWHPLGSLLFLAQALCAAIVLYLLLQRGMRNTH